VSALGMDFIICAVSFAAWTNVAHTAQGEPLDNKKSQ